MSKDIPDRYRTPEVTVAKRESKEDDIQDFAENTMNELLAWYGYGDKASGSGSGSGSGHVVHHSRVGHLLGRADQDPTSRPKTNFLPLCISDMPDPVSGHGQPVSDLDRAGLENEKASPLSGSRRQRRGSIAREASSHSLDSTQSFVSRHHRPSSVNSLTSTDSTESNMLAGAKVQTTEPDYALSHRLRAIAKTSQLCDWCKKVPPNICFADSVDGLSPLGFCSESCLNHYKMNLFCMETRQYLQQIQNSDDASEVIAMAASDDKILITPDLWMSEKKENKRRRCNDTRREIPVADDSCHPDDSEHDDDPHRHSNCDGSVVDSSSGLELVECLESKKDKRKKEETVLLSPRPLSNDASVDATRCPKRGSPHASAVDKKIIQSVEDKSFDVESARRSKRLKSTSQKESTHCYLTPKSRTDNSDSHLAAAAAGRDTGKHTSLESKVKARHGSANHETLHQSAQMSMSDASSDHLQFPRLASSEAAANFLQRLKVDGLTTNCQSSQPAKSNNSSHTSPHFSASSAFAPVVPPPPVASLFSPPGLPSLMHLLGPTLSPQFWGPSGPVAAAPSFPFLGFPPMLSAPGGLGGGAGGVPVPPGIPVPPPPVTNPLAGFLPPNTLMIPYPVLLPLPIPIPIPFPVPAKQQNSRGSSSAAAAAADDIKTNQNKRTATDLDLREPDHHHLDLRRSHQTQKIVSDKASDSCFASHSVATSSGKDSFSSHHGDCHPRTTFCSSCSSDAEQFAVRGTGEDTASGNFSDRLSSTAALSSVNSSSQNVVIDFSMTSREQKSGATCLQTSELQNGISVAVPLLPTVASPSVVVKTEPLDLVGLAENNNFSTSSFSRSLCDLPTPSPLPYLARRSLILDAPSITKEKSVHGDKHFTDSSSKKFMYCKRRYPSIHIKTK